MKFSLCCLCSLLVVFFSCKKEEVPVKPVSDFYVIAELPEGTVSLKDDENAQFQRAGRAMGGNLRILYYRRDGGQLNSTAFRGPNYTMGIRLHTIFPDEILEREATRLLIPDPEFCRRSTNEVHYGDYYYTEGLEVFVINNTTGDQEFSSAYQEQPSESFIRVIGLTKMQKESTPFSVYFENTYSDYYYVLEAEISCMLSLSETGESLALENLKVKLPVWGSGD